MKKMELLALNQPAILSLIGTPPHTPDPEVQQQLPLPGLTPLASAPASTRTPRKLQHPQKSTSSESKRDSVIVSFKLVQHEDQAAPSLSISTTAVAGFSRLSRSRVKRRLFTSDYDSMEGSDYDMRVSSSLSLNRVARKPKCSPARGEMDGTDADDEMEHLPYSSSYLSPPYSPAPEEQNSPPADPSPIASGNTQQQPHRKASSGLVTPKVKTCASCKTKKTPLWRDSDDGTPYCNACGIRFKKYHVRCSVCFYIPRKDEKINNSCCLCGARLVHCRHH